jgi:hypothetical protein
VAVVTKDAVSSLRVTGHNYSSIEAITNFISSIDEKGMGTQWSRHTARWIREEYEHDAVEKRSTPRHMKNVHTARTNSPSRTNESTTRQADRKTKPRGSAQKN